MWEKEERGRGRTGRTRKQGSRRKRKHKNVAVVQFICADNERWKQTSHSKISHENSPNWMDSIATDFGTCPKRAQPASLPRMSSFFWLRGARPSAKKSDRSGQIGERLGMSYCRQGSFVTCHPILINYPRSAFFAIGFAAGNDTGKSRPTFSFRCRMFSALGLPEQFLPEMRKSFPTASQRRSQHLICRT